jgi:hypothetical protein
MHAIQGTHTPVRTYIGGGGGGVGWGAVLDERAEMGMRVGSVSSIITDTGSTAGNTVDPDIVADISSPMPNPIPTPSPEHFGEDEGRIRISPHTASHAVYSC